MILKQKPGDTVMIILHAIMSAHVKDVEECQHQKAMMRV